MVIFYSYVSLPEGIKRCWPVGHRFPPSILASVPGFAPKINGEMATLNVYPMWVNTRPGKHTKNYWKLPFIVSFPMKNGGSFHRFLYVYQAGYPNLLRMIPGLSPGCRLPRRTVRPSSAWRTWRCTGRPTATTSGRRWWCFHFTYYIMMQ